MKARILGFILVFGMFVAARAEVPSVKLLNKIPLPDKLAGGFAMPADLTGDGRMDILLSYVNHPYSAHTRLVAINQDGRILWQRGDTAVTTQDFSGSEPPCRPLITAYDFNGDGKTEIVVEFWDNGQPKLEMLAGHDGAVLHSAPSPFDLSVRRPEGHRPSRATPKAVVAWLDGRAKPPSVVVKYDASSRLPTVAAAYDRTLSKRWQVRGRPNDMGHPLVAADITGDGRDDVILGQWAVNAAGETIFRRDFLSHADGINVFDINGGKRMIVTICSVGPAYCLDARGQTVWEKTQQEVPHGQRSWVGDFFPDRPGLEAVVQVSGHYGIFHVFAAEDGKKLAEFEQRSGIKHKDGSRRYPDEPTQVRWLADRDVLWVPLDRMLLDGKGEPVAQLGQWDAAVVQDLKPGSKKNRLAVQAIALDVCGDDRQEIVLYQPYHGRAIYIFTQADADTAEKPFRPQENVYNRPSNF